MAHHVLMVVSDPCVHDPRVAGEAEALAKAGHRVTVLGWDRAGEHPRTEEVTPGEAEGTVRIVRVRNTTWMRLLPFDILRLRPWWRLAARTARDLHRDDPFTAVHCHDLDTLPAGSRLTADLDLPLVFDAHEIWSKMLARELPGLVADRFERIEQRLLPEVDRVVTVTEPMVDHYEDQADAPVTLVMNAKEPPEEEWRPPDGGFRALYVGTLNAGRMVHELVRAAGSLDGVGLTVCGGGKPGYVRELERLASGRPGVAFEGRIPRAEVLPRTRSAHAVVAMFHPTSYLARYSLPNKLFEAMSAGRPVLVAEGTHVAGFVEDHGLGVVAPPTEEGIREGLARLRDDAEAREAMGRAGHELARDRYNWPSQVAALVDLYGDL